jgi:hypothetical protein
MTRFFHAGREIDFDQAVELMCDRVRRLKPRNNQDWLDEMPGLVAAIAAGEWSEDALLEAEITVSPEEDAMLAEEIFRRERSHRGRLRVIDGDIDAVATGAKRLPRA